VGVNADGQKSRLASILGAVVVITAAWRRSQLRTPYRPCAWLRWSVPVHPLVDGYCPNAYLDPCRNLHLKPESGRIIGHEPAMLGVSLVRQMPRFLKWYVRPCSHKAHKPGY
jgi:hypothetical protein